MCFLSSKSSKRNGIQQPGSLIYYSRTLHLLLPAPDPPPPSCLDRPGTVNFVPGIVEEKAATAVAMDSSSSSGLSAACWVVFLLLSFWGGVHGAGRFSQQEEAMNFIRWDDMRLGSDSALKGQDVGGGGGGSDNRTRVIVVDRSGARGDSTTVQGAVEMVPSQNTQRVKIYIYPGIYRYCVTLCGVVLPHFFLSIFLPRIL